jgi:FdhD protein
MVVRSMEIVETPSVKRFSVQRMHDGESERVVDMVAAEEPLEIRLSYWFKETRVSTSLAVTMRTPGHDRELAAGWLLSEGVIRGREQLEDLRLLGTEPSNEILAELSKEVDFEAWRLARSSFVSASCGVCGKRSREAILQRTPDLSGDDLVIDPSLLSALPDLLASHQEGFARTGGLHAAALINSCGEVGQVFEDIGRHNALDKLIGWCVFQDRIPLRQSLLFLSSRSSFELIQKSAMAGAPILATVGGPSSLAIEAARECGLTLVGFVRDRRFNVYSGEWRIHS